jgi:hypothetical protein
MCTDEQAEVAAKVEMQEWTCRIVATHKDIGSRKVPAFTLTRISSVDKAAKVNRLITELVSDLL